MRIVFRFFVTRPELGSTFDKLYYSRNRPPSQNFHANERAAGSAYGPDRHRVSTIRYDSMWYPGHTGKAAEQECQCPSGHFCFCFRVERTKPLPHTLASMPERAFLFLL